MTDRGQWWTKSRIGEQNDRWRLGWSLGTLCSNKKEKAAKGQYCSPAFTAGQVPYLWNEDKIFAEGVSKEMWICYTETGRMCFPEQITDNYSKVFFHG